MINKCDLCSCEIDQDNGDVVGCIGILKTCFCVMCLSGIHDMIRQMYGYDDPETLKEMINEIEQEVQ